MHASPASTVTEPVASATQSLRKRRLPDLALPVAGVTTISIAASLVALTSVYYLSWWFSLDRLVNPLLGLALLGTAAYVLVQVLGGCFVYINMRVPEPVAPVPGLKVDVFVPVYDEAIELVEQSLQAILRMRYPHTTYLLDDRRDPNLRCLAERLGVEYRSRATNGAAKAGNVNAALKTSTGEVVTIFDVDHVPDPDFLDKVLGYFVDPGVGFVQNGIGFRNEGESWIARAAVEQCEDAYGPTSMGMHGCDAAPVWGSHCTFRRSALDSIGGHAVGLAEDLHTSLRLHVAGWRSVFVPEVTAHGLAPADMDAVVRQQFKWAHGVFDVLFRVYLRSIGRLSFKQNAAYALRCTYYLVGPLFLGHMLVAAALLFGGSEAARASFGAYLWHTLPFAASVLYIRRAAWSRMPDHAALRLRWRGYVHTLMLWPVYTAAFVSRLLLIPVPHIATPKNRKDSIHPALVMPQVLLSSLLLLAVLWRISTGSQAADLLPMVFVLACVGAQSYALFRVFRR